MADAYLITESFYHLYSSVHSHFLSPLLQTLHVSVWKGPIYLCDSNWGNEGDYICVRWLNVMNKTSWE